MKVTTVGGGPGGLYASLLLAKAHPDWEITVHERDPPDETYGWGIVFPNRALPDLESADPESHRRITDQFHQWDPIDTFLDERRYRCDGHAFASMMRTNLLSILQERCRELDVNLCFESPIADPDALAAESDLLIGADGIGSQVRDSEPAFGTDVVEGTDRFAWFGTDVTFEALTHTFDHNEDGVWRIHAYPGETTTFIVDCDADTWERSGLEDASEAEYLAYLEETFAGYLDGHEILNKEDRWWTFRTVRNDTWVNDNVVLLGDAAHTAHFSVGSGTTLAMGDAIALAESLEGYDPSASDQDGLGDALEAFEAERKPFVERIQQAAELSRIHYEHSREYLSLPDLQFTIHHLTRSGRITYDSLARRDPSFIAGFDRWFAAHAAGDDAAESVDPPAFQPRQLATVRFPNRTMLPVSATAGNDGVPDGATREAVADAAALGPGLVLVGSVAPTGADDASTTPLDVSTETQARVWGELVGRARSVAADQPGTEAPPVGLRITADAALSPTDVSTIATAADQAGRAGFDVLELDFGLDAMGAPLSGWGSRRTLPLEVVPAVRDVWQGVLAARLPAVGPDHGIPDAVDAAGALSARGVDLLAITGDPSPVRGVDSTPVTVDLGADRIRTRTGVPTVSTRGVGSLDAVNTLVGAGRADLVQFDPDASDDVDPETAASLAEQLL